MISRLLPASVAVAVLLSACTAPPPPAPEPKPAAKKKEKAKPVPAPTAPAPVAPAPTTGPVTPSDQFKVTVDRTPFYNYGPQQPGGPSLSLEKGTILTLLKRGFGYSQVRLKDQQVGFVGNEDMVALTPQELLAAQNAGRPVDLGVLPPRPGGIKRATIPPLTFDELPKPEVGSKPEKKDKEPKADAAPSPTPAFRY
ncbi:MAG: SH3 domain-containing protein [Verrucomicrobia bacterium]|nr:SH3 domain-containing protein [Verrucomicrobiota bacterium]